MTHKQLKEVAEEVFSQIDALSAFGNLPKAGLFGRTETGPRPRSAESMGLYNKLHLLTAKLEQVKAGLKVDLGLIEHVAADARDLFATIDWASKK